jgi:FkbM family methyltransferase
MTRITNRIQFLLRMEDFRQRPLKTIVRLTTWWLRSLMRHPAIIRLEGVPLRMFLPALWHGQAKLLYIFNWRYEKDLQFITKLLKPGAVVVDVGANIGLWALMLAHTARSTGSVIACEPSADTYKTLKQNIQLNKLANTHPLRIALSYRKAKVRLYHDVDPSRHSLGSTATRGNTDFEEIETDTMDAVVQSLGISKIDFIKIDVEGAEELVLAGSRTTLSQSKPIILFEINGPASASLGLDKSGAWKLLEAHGYRFFTVDDTIALTRIGSPPTAGNVLAMHSETSGMANPDSSRVTPRFAGRRDSSTAKEDKPEAYHHQRRIN